MFTPVEPTQQKVHDNGRPHTLGKRIVDSESESPAKDNVKCMRTRNENLDIDLKVKTSF